MPTVDVTRTFLQLLSPGELRPVALTDPRARIVRRAPCDGERYLSLYRAVGGPWHWRERLAWRDDELDAYLARSDVGVWELTVEDAPAGYFELRRHGDGTVEIAYFGLAPDFIGRGLGGAMLSRAATEAWAMGATRVWLHTCTLDSSHALPNYRARGFQQYKEERYTTEIV